MVIRLILLLSLLANVLWAPTAMARDFNQPTEIAMMEPRPMNGDMGDCGSREKQDCQVVCVICHAVVPPVPTVRLSMGAPLILDRTVETSWPSRTPSIDPPPPRPAAQP